VVTILTAKGFSDLVIEDQEEFETFLEENKAYWDYIDEEFQEKLQGLSHIKLYLEDTDNAGMQRLEKAVRISVIHRRSSPRKMGMPSQRSTALAMSQPVSP
jgi:ribosomal protein L11 methyltransferase